MDFDKAQIARRVASQLGDVINAQAGMQHGVAQGDALGVLLVQPFGFEVADQRAGSQERCAVALAFFFGKSDHFQVVGQAAALAVEFAHAGHGHEDAQAAIVFAAVAHGVVMAAGHQRGGVGAVGAVAAHHVAHRVDFNLVEAAVAHPVRNALRAGAVRLGQIGDGKLALLGVAGVAMDAEAFLPVPDVVTQGQVHAEFIRQADLDDAVDVAQRFLAFNVGRIVEPAREFIDDLLAVQTRAARAAHGQDEGKAEARVVVGVQLLQARQFVGRAMREPRLVLFVGGFRGQAVLQHGAAGQFRVRADQCQLRFDIGLVQHLPHLVLQMRQGPERARRQRLPRDPRRMFVQAVKDG
ncbi:hypothetical protein D3C71_1221460 [compost metagenome]